MKVEVKNGEMENVGVFKYCMESVVKCMLFEYNDSVTRETIIRALNPLVEYYSQMTFKESFYVEDATSEEQVDVGEIEVTLCDSGGKRLIALVASGITVDLG